MDSGATLAMPIIIESLQVLNLLDMTWLLVNKRADFNYTTIYCTDLPRLFRQLVEWHRPISIACCNRDATSYDGEAKGTAQEPEEPEE